MVSIIMPTYNRGYIIERAIDSVLEQTYLDFELIIIDDGSTDNTRDLVLSLKDDRLRYINANSHHGAGAARNIGIEEAQGAFLAFLDSDNTYRKDHIAKRVKILKEADSPVFTFGRMIVQGNNGDNALFPGDTVHEMNNRRLLLEKLMISNRIDTNTVVMTKDCLMGYRFDAEMKALEDWRLFFEIVKNENVAVVFDDEATVIHYDMSDSLSRNKLYYWESRIKLYREFAELMDEYAYKDNVDTEIVGELNCEQNIKMIYENAFSKNNELQEFMKFVSRVADERYIEILNLEKRIRDLYKSYQMHKSILEIDKNLNKKNIKSIAIYGYGEYGKKLLMMIDGTGICVKYIIDRTLIDCIKDSIVYTSKIEVVNNVDAIIVAIYKNAEEITKELATKTGISCFTLMDLFE